MPYHLVEERLTEESAEAADQLGTTRRGIGPCYRDKVGRVHGIRVADLYRPDRLPRAGPAGRRLQEPVPRRLAAGLRAVRRRQGSPTSTSASPSGCGRSSATRPTRLHRAIDGGERLLFEGAQGSLLDIDHGSYPYVTSSNSSAAGVWAGSGVPARASTAGSAW